MLKIVNKGFAVFFLLFLVTVMMAGSTLNASALSPGLYDFGTWTGSGTISVTVNGKSDTLKELTYGGDDIIDPSNYTVKKTSSSNTIILSESYLKNLDNGTYSFWAHFSAEGEDEQPGGLNGKNVIFSANQYHSDLIKLTNNGEIVDSSKYTVKITGTESMVTLNDDYFETLTEENHFVGLFLLDGFSVVLKLTVDAPNTSSETPSTSSETPSTSSKPTSSKPSSESPTTSVPIPETGAHTPMAAWLVIMYLSIAGCVVTLIIHKRRRSQQ